MPPDSRVHVGVGGICFRPSGGLDELLMIKRGGQGQFASDGYGTWSVPGGWLDFGESPEQAAEREVLEESGVTVKATARLGFVQCISAATEAQIVTLFIACRYVSGEPTVTEPEKCPEVEWVTLSMDDRPLFAPLQAWRDLGRV